MQEKVSFVPVSRENLERAQYPTEILDVLTHLPGTFATGFYQLQNAVLLSDGQEVVESFPSATTDSFLFLYAKTKDALTMIQHFPPVIECPEGSSHLAVHVVSTHCVSPMWVMTRTDAFALPFTRVWVEYDVDNDRFLVGYVGTALDDFRNQVYHPSDGLVLPVVRYWVLNEEFSLSTESQKEIIRTALAVPGFEITTREHTELSPDNSFSIIKKSLEPKSFSKSNNTEELLSFYLTIRNSVIKRKGRYPFYPGFWAQAKVLSLFSQGARVFSDVESSVIRMLNSASVALGKKKPSALLLLSISYDTRFLASCALYPVLAGIESMQERFRVLDFFARGCETLTPGSLSYDDIVCAWEDNAIPWELSPTVGMQFVAGYARELEDTPTARMKNFALGKGR